MSEVSDQAVHLPAQVREAIIAHAREGKPEEICGVVRGKGLVAYEAIRGRNIAAERIENYEVDPQTLLLQFQFEEQGEEMMGIYHSHPVSVAYPSATDAWNAHYPECIYFICSLEYDDAPVIRAFRLTPHFLDLDWAALKEVLPVYETRRNLWAYYQAAGAPAPPALADTAAQVAAPFYVVMFGDGDLDGRVVSVAEHPIRQE
ncbi:MAG TPA: M67 family metallopeptidase [Caldilineaceae bacterium]|nr:M67 family metallopeptidase [Caldilineaceae bacterium]